MCNWEQVAGAFGIRAGVTYLNHGSFGPSPEPVRRVRQAWQAEMDSEPMDFFVRRLEPALRDARRRLADFVGAADDDLVLVENATAAMNIVARSFPLTSGNRVALTNHEYGAVFRIWSDACTASGAHLDTVRLPILLESPHQVAQALVDQLAPDTRLLVLSHITSATALVVPVREIVQLARQRGVAVCIDGPHAPLHLELNLQSLAADFYTASCHKWLSAPFGTGFLYVDTAWQPRIRPLVRSWGRLQPARPESWSDEFLWSGTRDPSALLAIPAAIDFFDQLGCDATRRQITQLASYAREQLVSLTQLPPMALGSHWYAAMAHAPLPDGDAFALQRALWDRHKIEVPIIQWENRRYIRVSTHLYNTPAQIDQLVCALRSQLRSALQS